MPIKSQQAYDAGLGAILDGFRNLILAGPSSDTAEQIRRAIESAEAVGQ
ncbi:MAG: hypothetical protein OXH75_07720 [Acidobacteria bacterium]|nr:hypothetical protein [Acidobacteriota bacterium]